MESKDQMKNQTANVNNFIGAGEKVKAFLYGLAAE